MLPLAVAAIYVKQEWLEGRGFRRVKIDRGSPGLPIPLLEQFAFFRGDLLLTGIALPLAVALACRILPRWARPGATTMIGVASILLLFLQFQALTLVGTLLPASQFRSALLFTTEQPTVAAAYLSAAALSVLQLAALIGLLLLASWWAWRNDQPPASTKIVATADWAQAVSFAVVGLLAATAWLAPATATVYHRSVLIESLKAFVQGDDGVVTKGTPAELLAAFRRATGIPDGDASPRRASAAGYDVVFFVMETVPERCARLDGEVADLPTVAGLRNDAFVARRHYTPQPWSSYALFSIFSSWYPPQTPQNVMWNPMWQLFSSELPTPLRALRRAGYVTAVFAPWPSKGEPDEQMFHSLGVDSVVYPSVQAQRRVASDSMALERLLASVGAMAERGQRFAVAFIPQASHGPWIDLEPARPAGSPLERCRRLVALQDRWLGRIVEVLRTHGRERKTLIVLTADHGVRSRLEDPSYYPGRLDDYSFSVPMLIYAPDVARGMVLINHVTSHVDVLPTVNDLIGIDPTSYGTAGAPIYASGLEGRMTLFISRYRLGVDGFHQAGRFLQWERIENAVMEASDSLYFGPLATHLSTDEAAASTREFRHALALHHAFLEHLFERGDLRR